MDGLAHILLNEDNLETNAFERLRDLFCEALREHTNLKRDFPGELLCERLYAHCGCSFRGRT